MGHHANSPRSEARIQPADGDIKREPTSVESVDLLGHKLSHLYHRRFEGRRDYRLKVWRRLMEGFFEPRFLKSAKTILDLGAGHGEFILNSHAPIRIAMDLNPDLEAIVQEDGVELLRHDCTAAWPITPDSVDVVFSSNLLEHLPSKEAIEKTLCHSLEAIAPGGKLILLGPNIRFVRDSYWDFWDHHIPLTERSLCELLGSVGFQISIVVPRFLPYTMIGVRPKPLWLVSLYLKLPLLWRVFGKQFLIVATKSHSPDPN